MKKQISGFIVNIEKGVDGIYVAKVPSLQSCATQGKTMQQATMRISEAIKVCLKE